MARKRTLSPEFFLHEGLAGCSPHARLLFASLWCQADREGRLLWLPMQVYGSTFPWEPGLDVGAMAAELEAVGCLRRYRHNGKLYADLPGFLAWQRPHRNEPDSRHPGAAPIMADQESDNGRPDVGQWSAVARLLSSDPLSSDPLSSDPLENKMSAAPPAVEAAPPPAIPPSEPRESQRTTQAQHLDQHWRRLSGVRPKPKSAASKKRLARWSRYLKDHTVAELELLTEYIADSPWWRGENNTSSDLLKAGPGKWLNDPEKAEARINEARAWEDGGRQSQPNPAATNRAPWERTVEEVAAEADAILRAKGIDLDAITI